MEFKIKLFNNTSDQNSFNLQIREEDVQPNLHDSLNNALQKMLDLTPDQFVVLSKNGVKIRESSVFEDGQMFQVCPTVLGGKGGFGSLLRAFGKQMQQSTNKEACRDLTGRRIRHVNNEKKLKEFVENQEAIAKEKEEKKLAKIEKRKKKRSDMEHSHHLFVDVKYDKQKEKIAKDLDEAIVKAISEKKKLAKTSSEEKTENDVVLEVTKKNSEVKSEKGASLIDINQKPAVSAKASKDKYSDWMGCDDLDVSSSDSESEDEKPAKKLKV